MKDRVFLKANVLLVGSLTIMSGATIAPSLPQMASVFEEIENADFLSKLILTVPALFIAIFAPVFGWLTDRFGRLKLLYPLLVLYAIGGCSGFFLNNMYHILAGRAVLGLAVAGIMPLAVTLIGDYFHGRERQKFMGMHGAFMSFGGIIFVGLGGFLADVDWRAPFLIYAFSLLILIISIFGLYEPKFQPRDRNTHFSIRSLDPDIWWIYATAFVSMIIFYMLPVQIPFVLKDMGIPQNSYAGLAIALATFAAIISGITYGKIRKHLDIPAIFIIVFMLMSTGFLCVAQTDSLEMLMTSMVISGLGIGLLFPNLNLWLLEVAPEVIRGKASGWLGSFVFLGQFFSPIIFQPILKWTSLSYVFVIAAFIQWVVIFIYLYRVFYDRRQLRIQRSV